MVGETDIPVLLYGKRTNQGTMSIDSDNVLGNPNSTISNLLSSFIEVIYLLNVGLASYNIQAHVPSDIPEHNQIIPNEHLASQKHLSKINEWTKAKKS